MGAGDRATDRAERIRTLDEQIAEHLQWSLASGELRAAPSWGKPLASGDGWDDTPVELRMPFKVLKDAGVVPAEVELLRRAAALRDRLHAAPDAPEAPALRRELAELEQAVALRLEHLRLTGRL